MSSYRRRPVSIAPQGLIIPLPRPLRGHPFASEGELCPQRQKNKHAKGAQHCSLLSAHCSLVKKRAIGAFLLHSYTELVAPAGNSLAAYLAIDVFESTGYLILFYYVTGYQRTRGPQYHRCNRIGCQTCCVKVTLGIFSHRYLKVI